MSALRRAGCVFAADEAALLREHASGTAELEEWTTRRIAGEPLEHLLGWVQFGALRLSVGPGVFVPRQRSLLLAHTAVVAVREARATDRTPIVVEAFCGVAPIAATVRAADPDVDVHVVDVDDTALGHARRNLAAANVHRGRVLHPLPLRLRGAVDVIAAVPPYVPDEAVDLLPHEARDHEPRSALTGGHRGVDAVDELIAAAQQWLRPGGELLVEMNAAQFDLVAASNVTEGMAVDAVRGDDAQTVVARLRRRPQMPSAARRRASSPR